MNTFCLFSNESLKKLILKLEIIIGDFLYKSSIRY